MKGENKCDVPHCKQIAAMGYFDRRICDKHWEQHCNGEIDLKQIFRTGGQDENQQ